MKEVWDTGNDLLHRDKEKEELDKMYNDRSQLTWSQRLSMMWRKDEDGNSSPELMQVYRSVMVATVTGGIYGSYAGSQRLVKTFLERNKYEMFKHPFEAQKALREKYMIVSMKGFARWGFKMGALTGIYMCIAQSLTAIRNYVNPLDHAAAGVTMGAIYRFNMGPKGMLSAGILGGILGLQGGCCWWLAQKVSGETVEQRWKNEYLQITRLQEIKILAKKKKDEREAIINNEAPKEEVFMEEEEQLDFFMVYLLQAQQWARDIGFIQSQITLRDPEEQSLPNSSQLNPKTS